MLFTLLATAYAAEVTEMPPELRGNVEIGYTGDFGFRTLEEKRQLVGSGLYQRHDLMFSGEFAPLKWLALNLAVPYTPAWSMNWDEAYEMRYDPTTETGTYVGGEQINDGVLKTASGSEGVWFGAAVAPFSQSYGSGLLHQLVDWRLGIAYRTGNSHTLWSAVNGSRGVAPGGGAWKISAAFSTTRGSANPYLSVTAVLEGKPVVMDIVDEEGTTWATGLPIDAASTFDIRGGIELTDAEIREGGYRFVWDIYCRFGYVTWQDIPSGIYLPTVLDASRGITITETDYVHGDLGMSAVIDVNHWAGFRLGVEGRYALPHRVEHPYPVFWSYDSFDVVAVAELEGRIRDGKGK